jgi:hypothetical protein
MAQNILPYCQKRKISEEDEIHRQLYLVISNPTLNISPHYCLQHVVGNGCTFVGLGEPVDRARGASGTEVFFTWLHNDISKAVLHPTVNPGFAVHGGLCGM